MSQSFAVLVIHNPGPDTRIELKGMEGEVPEEIYLSAVAALRDVKRAQSEGSQAWVLIHHKDNGQLCAVNSAEKLLDEGLMTEEEADPIKGRLRTDDQVVTAACQHTKPCPDCPFARKALRGWLGGSPVRQWLLDVRTDGVMPCHVFKNQQCAGASIYRRHIAKSSRDPEALVLPANHELVFSNDREFTEHHDCFKKSDD